MIVEYTEQEGNELLQLIDLAIKSQGLSVAAISLKHAEKLKVAFAEEKAESIVNKTQQEE